MYSNKGLSLIAALFIITALALMGAVVSYMSGGLSQTADNELRSNQALGAAEAGSEWLTRWLFDRSRWDGTAVPPFPPSLNASTTFVISNLKYPVQTTLSSGIGMGNTTLNVKLPAYSFSNQTPVNPTDPFPLAGAISIDNEVMIYTGKTAASFTGLTRGAYGTIAAPHSRNSFVYIAGRTNAAILAGDTTVPVQISINSQNDFPQMGKVKIEFEYIDFSGFTFAGGAVTALNNCTRGAVDPVTNSPTTASAHAVNSGVILHKEQAYFQSAGKTSVSSKTSERTVERVVAR